jgi:hypothetical protein
MRAVRAVVWCVSVEKPIFGRKRPTARGDVRARRASACRAAGCGVSQTEQGCPNRRAAAQTVRRARKSSSVTVSEPVLGFGHVRGSTGRTCVCVHTCARCVPLAGQKTAKTPKIGPLRARPGASRGFSAETRWTNHLQRE